MYFYNLLPFFSEILIFEEALNLTLYYTYIYINYIKYLSIMSSVYIILYICLYYIILYIFCLYYLYYIILYYIFSVKLSQNQYKKKNRFVVFCN